MGLGQLMYKLSEQAWRDHLLSIGAPVKRNISMTSCEILLEILRYRSDTVYLDELRATVKALAQSDPKYIESYLHRQLQHIMLEIRSKGLEF